MSLVVPGANALGALLSYGVSKIVDSVLSELTGWVADGAGALVVGAGRSLDATTTPSFGTAFDSVYTSMRSIGLALAAPLLAVAVIQALLRQEPSMLARTVALRLPVALVSSGVALWLVEESLKITDALSASVLGSIAGSGGAFSDDLALLLSGPGSVTAGFEGLVLALLAAMVAFVLWVELAVRSAVVAAATVFLPIALAGVIWPATGHWIRRLAETLAALVLSKLAMAAILVLAVATLGEPSGIGGVVEGIALFSLAVLAPYALLRVVPFVEAGAIGQFEGLSHRGGRALGTQIVAARDFALGPSSELAAVATQPMLGALEGTEASGAWFDALVEGFESELRATRSPGAPGGDADAGSDVGTPGA